MTRTKTTRLDHHANTVPLVSELVAVTGKNPRTCRRWLQENTVPESVRRAVRIACRGELAAFNPTWSGWQLTAAHLITPEGISLTPGELRAVPLYRQRLAALQAADAAQRAEIKRLARRLKALAEHQDPARRAANDDSADGFF